MPTQIITSSAFGGPDLDILFVTSASAATDVYTGEGNGAVLTNSAGYLFMVTGLGAKGFAGNKLRKSYASCGGSCTKPSNC